MVRHILLIACGVWFMLSTVAEGQAFMPSRSNPLLLAPSISANRIANLGSNKAATSAPCKPDALGYCVANIGGDLESIGCSGFGQGLATSEEIGTITFEILTPDGSIVDFTQFFSDDGNGDCTSMMSWSPDDPARFYSDPNLP